MNNKMKAGLGVLVLCLGAYFMSSSDGDGILEVSVMELGRKDLTSQVVADGVLNP